MDDQSMTRQGSTEQLGASETEAPARHDATAETPARPAEAYVEAVSGGGMPYFVTVHQALLTGSDAGQQAARKALSEAYERHRVEAVSAMEMAAADAGVVLAVLKWKADDFDTLNTGLSRVEELLITVRDAIEARMQLAILDAQAERAFAEATAGAR